MKISVIGLGKIGLPVALQAASKGFEVVGCDVNPAVVDAIERGETPPGLENVADLLREQQQAGRIRATTDTSGAVADTDVTVLLVPVQVTDGVPDYGAMDAAVARVAIGLRPGHLVVFETTLAVGTTRNRYVPMLTRGGLRVGEDLFVAFSPERVQSHRVLQDLARYPKVVGGVDEASTDMACRFYEKVLDAPVLPVRDAETAEMTKLAESVYRDVNIALANELARYAHDAGVDILEVIEAANTEPLSQLHQPGAGVGGHCIPVYPYFLLSARGDLELISSARRINDAMPGWVVARAGEALGGLARRRVLVLGLAYRADVRELSHSSGLALVQALSAAGAEAVGADACYSDEEIAALGVEPLGDGDLAEIDAVIVQALHSAYESFPWDRLAPGTLVLDGRNVLDPEPLRAAGLRYVGVGRHPWAPAG